MAPVLNLPSGYALVTIVWSGTAVPTGAVSTFGCQLPASPPTPAAAAIDIRDNITGTGGWFISGNGWPTSLTLNKVVVKFGPLETGPFGEAASGQAGGVSTADAYAPNCSLLVKKNTNQGGRRGQGRMFLPSLPENVVGPGGVVEGTTVSTINGRFATFHTNMINDSYTPVLLHRHDPDLGQSPVAPTAIQNWTVQSILATQRRRLRR